MKILTLDKSIIGRAFPKITEITWKSDDFFASMV